MNPKLALLALVALAQWAVPGYLIQRGQATLAEGTAYRFRTAPVDPADPFRGRYLTLDFEASWVAVPAGTHYEPGQRLVAPIEVGPDGYARLGTPQQDPPVSGDWLAIKAGWRDEASRLRVTLPFDRYYLNERAAPEAEQWYREANRRGVAATAGGETYARVRVRRGYAVLEELMIGDRPLRELREP